MNVILTGATGWLGRSILDDLLKLDNVDKVIAFIGQTDIDELPTLDRVTFLHSTDADVENGFKLAGADVTVIHSATVYDRDDINAIEAFLCNEVFALKCLDGVAKSGGSTFINIDSFFTKATDYASTMMSYIISKDNFKNWGRVYASKYGVKFVNATVFHIYGEKDDEKKFLPWVLAKLAINESVELKNPYSQRDFIYKKDVVKAIRKILLGQKQICGGYTQFDIGSGNLITILEVVRLLKSELKSKSEIIFDENAISTDKHFEIEANLDGIRRLGWKPEHTIKKGLKKFCDETK